MVYKHWKFLINVTLLTIITLLLIAFVENYSQASKLDNIIKLESLYLGNNDLQFSGIYGINENGVPILPDYSDIVPYNHNGKIIFPNGLQFDNIKTAINYLER